MQPITSRLRLALLTIALIGALAFTGIIVQGPRGGAAVPGLIVQGWPIKYLSVGKLHLDDITIGFVSRKAGGGQQDYL